MGNNNEERPFEVSDITDVRIIIEAKGKHYTVLPLDPGFKEHCRLARIKAVTMVVLPCHSVVDKPLEDIASETAVVNTPKLTGVDTVYLLIKEHEGKKIVATSNGELLPAFVDIDIADVCSDHMLGPEAHEFKIVAFNLNGDVISE